MTLPETVQLAAPQSTPATASGWTSGSRDAEPPARSRPTSGGTSEETTKRDGCNRISSRAILRPVASQVTTSAPTWHLRAASPDLPRSDPQGNSRATATAHFSLSASICGCTHRSIRERSPICQWTTAPLRPRPRSSTRLSSAKRVVPSGSMVASCPVATSVSVAAPVAQPVALAAVRSSTTLPIPSSAGGGRTARPSCSIVQSPAVPRHAIRPAPRTRALPPTGACHVSARAMTETRRQEAAADTRRKRFIKMPREAKDP
jgi:hypothetical protein